MRTTVGLLVVAGLLIGGGVVPGQAQPSTSDLAWQAVGATTGMAVGSLVGTVAAAPGLIQYGLAWEENVCSTRISGGSISLEMNNPTDAACAGQFVGTLIMGTAPMSAGPSIGALAGLLAVANRQGHSGSVVGAGLAVILAQGAVTTWNMVVVPDYTNQLIEQIEESGGSADPVDGSTLQPELWMVGTVAWIAMPIAAVLAYNWL